MKKINISNLVQAIPAITPQYTVNQVGELFLANAYQQFLSLPVVVDKQPVGMISRYQLMEIFLKLYGRDLYGRQSIEPLMNTTPLIVQQEQSLESASDYVIEHISMPITEDFIIVKGTDYVGVGNVLDLLKAVGRKLSKANKKITKLNTQLTVENRRLGAELAIARQLQAIVLPDKKEFNAITHLDINGFMIPADEVGGDYYDVLPQGEHIKIAIGDVTGHGLESGILMLMVQTIMQTLVTQGIHDLKTYLNIINRTVFNNLKRMEIDKNLTLVLLDYHQGCLQICGQHEELLVIRQDKVITIDTLELGFMLGIEADITPFLAVEQIQLAPGDGVVLYTDGITEARNKQGELFGLQRLSQVITAHWQCSAKEIRKAVIEQVYQFTQHQKPVDDMTIVVLKQR